MHQLTIKKINSGDLLQLQQIGRRTFSETFSGSNTEENMRLYLAQGFSLHKLGAALQDPDTAFYFAMSNDAVIGYLKLNFGASQTDIRDSKAVEIERIYVLQAYHGKQVGQALYEKATAVARQADADYIWLGVWEKNPRAIRFYEKNGFVAFDKHIFKLGEDEQTDIMMKKLLKTGAISSLSLP